MEEDHVMALFLALVMWGLVLSGPAVATADTRYSGTVTSVDTATRTVSVDEMGPWVGPNDGVVRRTVMLGPGTHVVLVSRGDATAPHVPAGEWPGGFREASMAPADIQAGDFVTVVIGNHEDGRQAARAVSVVRPGTESASIR
jgi:hypothetical protein